MPRGLKKNEPLTQLLFDNGFFKDERSFLGYDPYSVPHLALFGIDLALQRERVFYRAKFRCEWTDGKHRCPARENLELDHIQGGLTGRCDCSHNLQVLCRAHHEAKHARTIRSAKAHEEFNEMMDKP